MFTLNEKAILGSYLGGANRPVVPVQAAASLGGYGSGSSNFTMGGTIVQPDFSYHILDGFVNFQNQLELYKLFREIYTMDAITGPAIDQLASLPWSTYSLLGIEDKEIAKLYIDCLSELNLIRLMTYLSTTYLVLGTVIGSLVFDKDRGIFSDCILYNPDDCEVIPIPMIGYDPKVNVKISKEMIQFLNSTDVRDLEAKKELSPELQDQLKGGKSVALEPLNTIVIERTTLPGVRSLSYLSRILPIWIVEKALTRGTIIASAERQRGILQITCLTGDTLIDKNGTYVRLDSICNSREVGKPINVDFKTKTFDFHSAKVCKWVYQGEKQVYKVTTECGYSVKATADHLFVVCGKWRNEYRALQDLRINDFLVTEDYNGSYSAITNIEKLGVEPVYDISIDTSNGDKPEFFANKILVHNCGGDEYEYTEAQMQALSQLFANAARDPQGAIVVTRNDVNTNEVLQPTDFWSISNERDGFTNIKLRALGLSESFGSDSTYSSTDNAMSMFLEMLKNHRDHLTKSVLYDKVFMLLAKYHGFRRRTQAEIAHNVRYDIKSNHAAKDERQIKRAKLLGTRNMAEAGSFIIPEIKWTKELETSGDSNAMSTLQTAKELGLPLPLSLICNAAGVSLTTLLDSFTADIEARKKIKKYNDEIKKIDPSAANNDNSGGGMFSSVNDSGNQINEPLLAKLQHSPVNKASTIANIRDKNTLLKYLSDNMAADVTLTKKQAKQIINGVNMVKPRLVKM